MLMILFSSGGWESWDVSHRPAVPEGMPVLVDEDLRFDDGGVPRPVTAVNQWLRELPASGCASPRSWVTYGRALRDWLEFAADRGAGVFDTRERLRELLGAYAAYRACGPPGSRFGASTWAQHVSILSGFYRWAVAEGYAVAEPFTYRQARGAYGGERMVNLAVRRRPKPHVTVRYLEPEFASMFVRALAGQRPDGSEEDRCRGRELARNAAVGHMALATGLRLQEFTWLLAAEVPPLPAVPCTTPVPFPVPAGIAKGRKFRTTWISHEALAGVHRYLDLSRPLSAAASAWQPAGEPLAVTEPGPAGGKVNGTRVRWAEMRPAERARLVAPDGGSMLLAVRGDGGPFTAWSSVFTRTSERVRDWYEPRFPHVFPHRLRHTFAVQTLERLVSGHYVQAAQLAAGAGQDGALALYLSRADPMMVLRDLMGHSSVLTTEKYLNRLDMTRIYREARERAGHSSGQARRGPDAAGLPAAGAVSA
jgi:integrase